MARLVSFTLFLSTLAGCSGPSTASPEADAAPSVDVFMVEMDAAKYDVVEALDSALVDSDIDASVDTRLPCTQGDKCADLGKPCGSLMCTPCGWQSNMSDCEAGVGDADSSSDADAFDADSTALDADAPDMFDATPPVDSSDTSDTSPPDTSDTGVDTTPPPDTKLADTSPDDTGTIDTGPIDTSDATVVTDTWDTGTPDTGVGETAVADVSDSLTDSPSDTAPVKFGCSGWKRDAKFDAFKIDGYDADFPLGITGFAPNKVYVAVSTMNKGVIAFWNGLTWSQQDLSPVPKILYGMDGTSETDIWLTGLDKFRGRLYHRGMDGTWKEDTAAPLIESLKDVYAASATDVFLLGQTLGSSRVWKRSGSTWSAMTLPELPTPHSLRGLWGLDAKHVFMTGYHLDSSSKEDQGYLLYYDGISWTSITVPTMCVAVAGIHGTSMNDLFVTASKGVGAYVIYRLTDKLMTWTEVATSSTIGYGPVWSKYPGTVLAAGYDTTVFGAGGLRITTDDEVSPPKTVTVDSKGWNPSRFWVESDGKTVHLLHISTGGTDAGHYTGTCE